MEVNEITEAVIGAAIEVHRAIGPGLLESAYVQCLSYELTLRKFTLCLRGATPRGLQRSEARLRVSR